MGYRETYEMWCTDPYFDDKTKEELMLAIEKYIDYYTNKRVQRNLGVLTPLEFHEQKLENVA